MAFQQVYIQLPLDLQQLQTSWYGLDLPCPCSSESMRRNSSALVGENIKEAKKGSKKRRPTSTPAETYVKVNQQALQQKINALRETLRLQECSVEKLRNKRTHNKNKRWKSMMKSKHLSSNACNGRPPSTRIGKTLLSLATWEKRIGRNFGRLQQS